MGSMLVTIFRTAIFDDAAYREWRERPNLFLRGIVLIVLVTLIAGLITFGVNLVNNISPVNMADVRDEIEQAFEMQYQWNPGFQDPEIRAMMEETLDVIVPMVTDIAQIEAPLPRGITGFFQAVGVWLSRALSAIGGWLLYGALVLIAVKLLGGSAKLPDFMGTVALYAIPGLLGILNPVFCVGNILVIIGALWSIAVYVKAVSVASDLDLGRSVLAVFAPAIAIVLLGILLGILAGVWFAIVLAL
jgi:hypothetical protein